LNLADPNDDDFECLSSWHAHDSAAQSFSDASVVTVTYSAYTDEYTETDSNVPLTTLCDGRARALESYKYTTTTETSYYTPAVTYRDWPEYTEPTPTCKIATTACTPIMASYSSAQDVWQSAYENLPSPYGGEAWSSAYDKLPPLYEPHCATTSVKPDPDAPPKDPACSRMPGNCMIKVPGDKKLFYWPVTVVSGDLCKRNGSTVTVTVEPSITGTPNTAVVDGITFTSPTNYLSIEEAYAVIYTDYKRVHPCGLNGHFTTHSNVVVPLTTALSSRIQDYGEQEFESFDFADLNQPLPAEVYDMYKCWFSPCSGEKPIYNEGEYKPAISMPPEVLDLEDEWRSVGCSYIEENASGRTKWRVTPVPLQTPPPRPF
jgi:hypothetical protein